MAVATVDIACTVMFDIVNFTVFYPHVVGSYTATVPKTEKPVGPYFFVFAALVAAFVATKHWLRKEDRPHP